MKLVSSCLIDCRSGILACVSTDRLRSRIACCTSANDRDKTSTSFVLQLLIPLRSSCNLCGHECSELPPIALLINKTGCVEAGGQDKSSSTLTSSVSANTKYDPLPSFSCKCVLPQPVSTTFCCSCTPNQLPQYLRRRDRPDRNPGKDRMAH